MTAAPSVILHIGPHKTGTTYIQKNLLDNRSALARAGIDYPEVFCENPGHHALRRELDSAPEATAAALSRLAAQLQDSRQTAILSSETLSQLPEEQMAALRAALAPVPVQVVIYLRSRGPVIWSQWQEHVKHGDIRSFPDYVADLMLHTPDANMLDPLGLAVRSQRMIGPVSLVDYDGCVAEGRDLLEPLMQLATGGPVELPELNTLPVNKRMPQERVETLRMLNLISTRRTKRLPGKRVRMSFLSALRDRPDEVRAIEAEIAKMMRPHLRELRLDMLDHYCADRDRRHTATLEAAGVKVPPFGVHRAGDDAALPGFAYLPDSEVLFSAMPPLLRNLYDLVTAEAEAA